MGMDRDWEQIDDLIAQRDALQARLDAAEKDRKEWKDIASVFLAATEPDQAIPVMGKIMLAQVRGRAREAFLTPPAPQDTKGGAR